MTTRAASLFDDRPTALPAFVGISVAGHVLVVALWLLISWLVAGPKVDLEQKPIKASLVRLGKKRDEKMLPRMEAETTPPPPAQKQEVKVPVPAPPDNAVKIPTKDAKPDKTAAKDEGAKDGKKSLFNALAQAGKAAKPEELEGDPDGDKDGDSAIQEGERYFGLLKAVVRRNYDVSNTIDESERIRLKANVVLRIGSGGELVDVSLSKPSGNELFDSAVIGAVKKAAPFTAPPENLRAALKKDGVELVFSP